MHSAETTKNGVKIPLNTSAVGPRFGATKLAAAATRGAVTLTVFFALLLIAARPAQAQTETVLNNFLAGTSSPYSGLTPDTVGNFYGTTFAGGNATPGHGTIFELSPDGSGGWNETTLYSFCSVLSCADGSGPLSNVIFDSLGNLYGTTTSGGAHGAGVVFELTLFGETWVEIVLYDFCSQSGCTDGANPASGLIMDSAGNLYGTTSGGVFELSPSGSGFTEQVIYQPAGGGVVGGLTPDSFGNIFGATGSTVFELSPVTVVSPSGTVGWTGTVIHTFTGSPKDGSGLTSAPVLDSAENLFGVTSSGGHGTGVLYQLIRPFQQNGKWKEKVRFGFGKCNKGPCNPSGIVLDANDNIFGSYSGDGKTHPGAIFEFSIPNGKDWYKETILWTFNGTDGAFPSGNLILDNQGNIFGTTSAGGPAYSTQCGTGGSCGYGVAFEIGTQLFGLDARQH
jgi:uncharacterized repeat protein (TIGR03803 family)